MATPSAPLNPRVHPYRDGVWFEYDTPASDGGTTITAYEIYRGTSPSPTTAIATTGVVNYYNDTATLSRDTIYYWAVAAVNADGTGTHSSDASDQIDLNLPTGMQNYFDDNVYIMQFKASNNNGEETYYNEYLTHARLETKTTRLKSPTGQDILGKLRIYVDGTVDVSADDKIRYGNSDYALVLDVEEHKNPAGTVILKVIIC